VRAKAGGGQSSHDNKAGKAKSMGAQLRRYGEQALREDVAACLRLWSAHLQGCSRVLVAAPKTMRSDLFSVEDTSSSSGGAGRGALVLDKSDPRIVFVPFMVGRPTLEEARAVHDRCTAVHFHFLAEESDAQGKGAMLPDGPVTEKRTKQETPLPNSASVIDRQPPQQPHCAASRCIFEALQSGQEETVLQVLSELGQDPEQLFDLETSVVEGPESAAGVDGVDLAAVVSMVESLEGLSTALHLASAAGMVAVVTALLQRGASPLQGDVRGRTPYFLARDKDTRDAFRRYRGTEEGRDR
jgi:hypothetical protein